MVNNPRGQCMIINNEKFIHPNLNYRNGSQVDADNLEKVFLTLGFEVKIHKNLKKAEMEKELELFASRTEYSDMIILIVLSHGENGKIQCQDYFPTSDKKSDVAGDGEVSIFSYSLSEYQCCRFIRFLWNGY